MKKWNVKENKIDNDLIKNNPDIDPVILQLLGNRGLSVEQVKQFLKSDYEEQLHDPFLFKDMKASVDLINKHLKAESKIIIYGDYDADGVTATAVIFKTLKFLGCKNLDIYIPHRETEGYGINKNAVEEIANNNTKLIITVDTGIRSIDEIALTKEKGVDVILTDHHETGEKIPDCLIINPKVKGEKYPFRELAGVGVAFKLCQALLKTKLHRPSPSSDEEEIGVVLKNKNQTPPSPLLPRGGINDDEWLEKGESFAKWLLDYVAIGTIADLMPLVNENRVLVKYGLVVLNKTKRLGIEKLIEVAQSAVDNKGNVREIDAWQIGFQLAPRLNAAGRLGHASNAYQLLITEDEQEAIKISGELNNTNKERQDITQDIFEQADKDIDGNKKILFAISPKLRGSEGIWPAGVMGLVSGKLTEKYYRPSLAITDKQGPSQADGEAGSPARINRAGKSTVGSARSIPEFDVTNTLEQCAEYLDSFGGHKQAAGFTVKEGRLEDFLNKMTEIAEKELADVELIPSLEIDLEIDFKDVSEELHKTLQKLKPFGVKNAQPKFLSKNLQVVNITNMGADNQHIKLKVQSPKSESQKLKMLDAIAFSVPDEWKEIKISDKIDLVYYIDINEWNGSRSVQLKIIDLVAHNS